MPLLGFPNGYVLVGTVMLVIGTIYLIYRLHIWLDPPIPPQKKTDVVIHKPAPIAQAEPEEPTVRVVYYREVIVKIVRVYHREDD